VLTGGPAVGKTSTGRALAERLPLAVFIDVDDLRQLVVAGHEAWGVGGDTQRALGASNACALAERFGRAGFEVAIADVLTPATTAVYRRELPGCILVHLTVALGEARRRAAMRRVWLTEEEFDGLHRVDALDPPPVDHRLDVTALPALAQRAAVEELWAATAIGQPSSALSPSDLHAPRDPTSTEESR